MNFINHISKKAYKIRKKHWSAPTVFAIFIFFCMILVFSFECIGILQKEKNIDYRIVEIAKSNYNINYNWGTTGLDLKKIPIEDHKLINKMKNVSENTKKKKIEKMLDILIEGAINQINHEKESIVDIEIHDYKEEYEFFDM